MTNKLYYGDNLDVLRASIASESVDLIYLDPPFNSNASYNVLFKAPSGAQSQAQIEAFDDTWHWDESAERAFDEVLTGGHSDAAIMLKAMRSALGENDMMAYLAMMAVRLIELHRVLKPTGSLYLHCDPTASHYLKIFLDCNLWRIRISRMRSSGSGLHQRDTRSSQFWPSNPRHYSVHTQEATMQLGMRNYTKYDEEYVKSHYSNVEPETGRRYQLDNMTGPGPEPTPI